MSASKAGITLPGEADDKCCFCIPIKPGVIIIGIFIILWAVEMILGAVNWLGIASLTIFGIIQLCAVVPMLLAAWYYISWFRADSAATRVGLSRACMLVILSSLISLGIQVIMLVLAKNTFSGLISNFISAAIVCVVYFYYAGVTKRFAS